MKDLLPSLLGGLLGAGGLMAWRGFRLLSDRKGDDPARRKGFWWLNGGLALIALSVILFTLRTR